MMHANHREEIEECYAGDIVAGVGLKQTSTGDTLSAPDAPVMLEKIEFPEPVIAVAIEPKTKSDQEKLGGGLARLAEEDPTFRIESDEETGQTLISGMGELHLEVIVDRLMREFNVDANVGRPQVAYRETIRDRVEKVVGPLRPPDRRQGPVRPRRHQRSSPLPRRASTSSTRSRAARSRASTSPRSSRGSRRRSGPASRPATRWSTSGSSWSTARTTTSTPRRWRSRSPARWRSRRPTRRAKPVLLEPVMAVEVVTPEEFLGDVIGDLSRRRGKVQGQEPRGNALAVTRSCRSARCSATRPTCARRHRAARPTRCSSSATRRSRRASPRRSSNRRAGSPSGQEPRRRSEFCNPSGVARRQTRRLRQDGQGARGTRWRRSSTAVSRT